MSQDRTLHVTLWDFQQAADAVCKKLGATEETAAAIKLAAMLTYVELERKA